MILLRASQSKFICLCHSPPCGWLVVFFVLFFKKQTKTTNRTTNQQTNTNKTPTNNKQTNKSKNNTKANEQNTPARAGRSRSLFFTFMQNTRCVYISGKACGWDQGLAFVSCRQNHGTVSPSDCLSYIHSLFLWRG